MINDNRKVLAIIPARGGSKRLPRKNVLPLAGSPLITWTIEAALASKYIDTVMVSTDCSEIADVARKGGADVPFLRSSELSSDTATSVDVVINVIDYYKSIGQIFDLIILLQPTSPLRTFDDINQAIHLFESKNADAVISVTECEHSPLWCNTLSEQKSLTNFITDDVASTRSQDLPTYYRLNGAIYLLKTSVVEAELSLFPKKNSFAFVMNRNNSVDIDEELDFKFAEFLLANHSIKK